MKKRGPTARKSLSRTEHREESHDGTKRRRRKFPLPRSRWRQGATGARGAAPVHAQVADPLAPADLCRVASLGAQVAQPAIEALNAIAGDEMQIDLFFARPLCRREALPAMQRGPIDAVQSEDDSMMSPTEVTVFGGYFPFASRYFARRAGALQQFGVSTRSGQGKSRRSRQKPSRPRPWTRAQFNTTRRHQNSLEDLAQKRASASPFHLPHGRSASCRSSASCRHVPGRLAISRLQTGENSNGGLGLVRHTEAL